MTGWIEDSALRFMGLDDNDIKKLNERIPDVQNLIHIVQTHQDQLNRVINDLAPILQKIIAKQRSMGQ